MDTKEQQSLPGPESKRMPRPWKYALAITTVVLVLVLGAWLWGTRFESRWNSLQIGMTRGEVFKIMGMSWPNEVSDEDEIETWIHDDRIYTAKFDGNDRLVAKYPANEHLVEPPSLLERLFMR